MLTAIHRVVVVGTLLTACRPTATPPAPPIVLAFEPEAEAESEAEAEPDPPALPQARAQPEPRRCPPVPAQRPETMDFSSIEARIESERRWEGIPSITAAVGIGGEIVWEYSSGYADVRRRKKATPDTMYSLASISKPLTASGLMVLRERGVIDLDASLNDYLPSPGIRPGVGDPRQATVRRVAMHTAGLPLHFAFFYDATPPSPADTMSRHAVLVTQPGERRQYSNLGYGLLGLAIAHVSGQDYADFMRDAVFTPLGMKHTAVGAPRRGDVAVRYDGRGVAIPPYTFDHDGASAIYSSARDLVVFGMTHLGFVRPGQTPLLPAEAFALMRETSEVSPNYGLGWSVSEVDGIRVLSHGGGMPGVATILLVIPQSAMVVTVLTNSSSADAARQRIAHAAARVAGLPARAPDLCALPENDELLGTWIGTLDIEGREVAMTLVLDHDGRATTTLGSDAAELFGVSLVDGNLKARLEGITLTQASRDRDSDVGFDLQVRPGRLTGSVTVLVPHRAGTTGFADLRPAG